ncbi:MAG: DUF4919 domain-containing protein [Aggregatilineaceae bacterium]
MTYQELLDAVRADPVDADYHALRMAYTRSDHYQPHPHDHDTVALMNEALRIGDLDGAMVATQKLLDRDYLDIMAHMVADYIYTSRDDTERALYHRAIARGLIDAVLATGNGNDFHTAFIVINTLEEYVILRVLGFVLLQQEFVEHEGHYFDVLVAQHQQTGDMMRFVFNIDLPFGWFLQHQSEDEEDNDEEWG